MDQCAALPQVDTRLNVAENFIKLFSHVTPTFLDKVFLQEMVCMLIDIFCSAKE